ncbi:Phenylalanine--tRNA ligase, chloroplastic/mitochondrial [Olea europaea subsp. europaea]|uniref:Phenylalanine--tRNA ligase, chloroplastic/mitochondrial n=1 Tax=Olea europaea subsp. europaea TaxID=158383 RepID=A0A8S0SMC9_OLEEU|nr:Phenylalanine--tRNA ligase, chloroplastic/mitochondrial [Olea europaea subsp. europaea]
MVLSVSLFWTGAVLCNVVHGIVSGMVFLVIIHGDREQETSSLLPQTTDVFLVLCCHNFFWEHMLWIALYGCNANITVGGVEALVAYDCSGAVLLMGTLLGGLIAVTCAGVWCWILCSNSVLMVGSTAMLMGMILVGLVTVVVESAVTSLYPCYAQDLLLIHRWDAPFFEQMSEKLHQRVQHRSARSR